MSDDLMIPASKVREIARRYAREHGLCSVVDKALEEIGALADERVEVTFTKTVTVTLLRADLAKLEDDAASLSTQGDDVRAFLVPDADTLESAGDIAITKVEWRRSGPVPAGSGGWVRVPGVEYDTRTVLQRGMRVREVTSPQVLGTVINGYADCDGDVKVQWDHQTEDSWSYADHSHLEYLA